MIINKTLLEFDAVVATVVAVGAAADAVAVVNGGDMHSNRLFLR